ncbi:MULTISPECIES: hypothetical protein [unclassified Pseudofrankia]|uniref:hypothetical protein n=1 Tax=unclassified Pseudofrankia TaxID=2994372 RepID=UPI0008D951D2|nr:MULTISPECIES: hypothetical protein [unclassified Pseudofrankia]MDT3438695.1 hypothetical protein [Pseudofrankia sp. BMG5.37]OHV56363.1 hypothetical protein BCD48_07645 [Pseudofrankia sp. BMG5.36]
MRDEQALIPRPGALTEPLTLVSELDGSVVTVGTQPGIDDGTHVIVMRLQSSLLDVLNAVYLMPVEAQRLADSLSSAAAMAVAGTAAHADRVLARLPDEDPCPHDLVDAEPAGMEVGAVDGDDVAPDGNIKMDGMAAMHTVTASEGASAAQLRDALGTLPPSAELVDFGADADVVLVFVATPRSSP